MITVSDYVATYLKKAGIEHVFMITGGGAMYLNNAFGKQFKPICFHHEQACTIAAEGYARINNKIPIVNLTTGPGGTNGITGVLGAWTDSIPMLVISGQVPYNWTVKSTGLGLRQLGDQECDITKMVAPITKYATMITDPCTIKYHLEKALHIAQEGRPGPVWLDIPLNVQSAIVDEKELEGYSPTTYPTIDQSTIQQVIHCLKNAKRPVVMAGYGIRAANCFDDFRKLIERLQIPTLTAFTMHDLVESSHPLCMGRPGIFGERGSNFILQNADLLLVLGSRLEVRSIAYKHQSFAINAKKIMVDIDENELKKPTLSIDMPIHVDLKDFINQMLCLDCDLEPKHSWIEWCKNICKKYPVILPEYREGPSINPYGFIEVLGQQLSENQIVVCGNGSATVLTSQGMQIKKGQRLLINSGTASMGWDIPAAIGAYLASGEKIVCLAGDGSIQMNIQELQTIRHHNLPIKIFLLNNNGYHSIRQTQTNQGFNPVGFDNTNGISFPAMERIAPAYLIRYLRCYNYQSLKDAITNTMSGDDPVICEIMLNPEQPFSPKIVARKAEDGSMVACSLDDMWPFLGPNELKENSCTE